MNQLHFPENGHNGLGVHSLQPPTFSQPIWSLALATLGSRCWSNAEEAGQGHVTIQQDHASASTVGVAAPT